MSYSGLADGLLHAHTSAGGADASDYTGVLTLAAGAVLVGLAIPFLHLGDGTATRARRWAYGAAAVVATSLLVYSFVYPVTKIAGTHDHRKPIGDEPGASDGSVTLPRTPPAKGARIGSGPVRMG